MSIWDRLLGKKDEAAGPSHQPQLLPVPPARSMRSPGVSPGSMPPAAATPGAKTAAAKDRVVRVFVSSTFKDMVEDRNELMAHVWPALRKVCRGRVVEFVEVDLRWGVTEEQSQRKETLRHCLAEIRRCRPYFIGLLGERYGWTPGPEAFSLALLDEEDWLKNEVAKHSVTELEILHGVLNDPEMAGRAFFYFRDPKYAASKGGDYLPEDADRPTRQDVLKQKVKAVCRAKQIPLHENYANPRALADLVLADLTAAIDAEFPPDQVPDVWSREDRDHEAYARSRRTNFYVGRDTCFNRLEAFVRDGADGCGLTVLGESGGGKSALLANWVARWRQAHPGDFVFQHYIGSSAMSSGHLALMRRLMVAIVRWCSADDPADPHGLEEEKKIPARAEEIVKVFPDYLSRLAAQARQKCVGAILVLDALNQLEDRERGRLLAWLPARLPDELRLVVSTLPGDTLKALQPHCWPALTVEPLTPDERVQLIARYLKHFSQGLSEARARKIAGASAASNPLYIKSLLDDLRATGDHQLLDQQIADYLQAADIPALLGKILTRFERDYERDRPRLVREALPLLWAARRGLTEPELLAALRPAGQEQLPAALWSPVRCALEDGLVDRDGVLDFAHEHLRTAVQRRYVSEAATAHALRLRLADDFARRPVDARQADELPWLLRQAESCDRLRACLLDIDRFRLMQERNDNELLGYWVWLKEERTMGKPYVQAFERWAGPQTQLQTVTYGANQLALFLHSAGFFAETESLWTRTLELSKQVFGHNDHGVIICHNNLAQVLKDTDRFAEAEQHMRLALTIVERHYGKDHSQVALQLNNLATLLVTTNRSAEAEPLLRRTLEISELCFGRNHPKVGACLGNLSSLLAETNRQVEAERLMRRAIAIDEQSLGHRHPDLATHLNNFSTLLQATNRRAEAEPLMRRALAIDEATFGKVHPNVARDLNNLGSLLQAANQLAEAEPLMRRALDINETRFSGNSTVVATCLNNLGSLLQATNRLAEAEPLMRRALAIDEATFGKAHPNVARDLSNLAGLLQDTGRLDDAELFMCRALNIYEASLGENHPSVAITLNNLAQIYQNTSRATEAEPLMRRALAIDETNLGKGHPTVATRLNNLAHLLRKTNRSAEAEPMLRLALAILETKLGPNHPNVAPILNTLAQVLKDTDRFSEAETMMRRALTILEQHPETSHPLVLNVLNNLAQLLKATNRYTEAEPMMRRVIETCLTFKRVNGYPHPYLKVVTENYIRLLLAMGRSEVEIEGLLASLSRVRT